MGMTTTPVEIDDEALAAAAHVLGTTTTQDTVNAALREVAARPLRLQALAELGAMADRGDFDELLGDHGEALDVRTAADVTGPTRRDQATPPPIGPLPRRTSA